MVEDLGLEQVIEVFPEVKEFIDYVVETGGQKTLKIEDKQFIWVHEREVYDGRPTCFYRMELTLDRDNPKIWLSFREGQIGTAPVYEPVKGQEILDKLPEILEEVKGVYEKCFLKDQDIF